MNRQIFYQKVKVKLFPSLKQSTLNGINAIVDEWEKQGISDNRQLAYILATVYHECARKMQPIEEFGKGKGKAYGSKIKSSRKPYSTPNKLYYGRGFVQLTWYENYVKAGKKLGIDLLNTPELALELSTASAILVRGMIEGWFTGTKLKTYINSKSCDFVKARHIINGTDCDDLIAVYADDFLECLT
jgi:predicted chitinase